MNDLIPLTTLLEITTPPMVVVDAEGLITALNPSAESLLSSSSPLLGQNFCAHLNTLIDVDEAMEANLPRQLMFEAIKGELFNAQVVIKNMDGRLHYLQVAATPMFSMQVAQYLIVLSDVTALKSSELELARQNRRLQTQLEDWNHYAVIGLDLDGRIQQWGQIAQKIYGLTAQAAIGLPFSQLFVEDSQARNEPQTMLDMALQDGRYESQCYCKSSQDKLLWVGLVITTTLNIEGAISGFSVLTRLGSHMQDKSMLAFDREDSFKGAFHDAPIGMMLVDMDWQVLRVNRSICEMLGYTQDELLSKTFQDITHPEDISSDLDLVRQMIAGDINDYRLEKRYLHKDGHIIWMLLSVSLLKDANKIPQHFIFHIQDITEYKRIQKQISEYAYQDALTNLPNRRLLQDRLKLAVKHAKRYKRRLGLMFLDIDYFKAINDTYGHAFGDELIKAVANRLTESVRSADTVCRLGGDEFVVVVTEVNQTQDITRIAEKIIANARRPITIENTEVTITLSVGVVMFDAHAGDDADSLMRKADQALYEMKREGRNGYRVFLPEMAKN